MVKKGDTLIKVMLAVGIFSMIAIAVVAVMSGGTSSAQTALETTLAREEIDAQAEALRFIQSSYLTGGRDNENNPYATLWKAITNNANDQNNVSDELLKYTPSSCSELYNPSKANNIFSQKAFILNTRMLGSLSSDADKKEQNKEAIKKIFYSADENNQKEVFNEAQIYPRLIYGANQEEANQNNSLIDDSSNNLISAEGIYIIAVKDQKTTQIVDIKETTPANTAAFYDFYIRTCWYGSDADRPSTISTVIRLYDPDATSTTPKPTEP